MDKTTSHHLKRHFLAIFDTFTLFLSINGMNTPLRHDPTILTPFWANMGKIRGKEAEKDSLLRMNLSNNKKIWKKQVLFYKSHYIL